jgi:hypothetical protein
VTCIKIPLFLILSSLVIINTPGAFPLMQGIGNRFMAGMAAMFDPVDQDLHASLSHFLHRLDDS